MRDKWKLWNYIKKNIIKRSRVKTQCRLYNSSKTGIVLKKYKSKWYRDKVIDTIGDRRIKVIKKMRIGNSDLNYHKKDVKLSRICPNCDKRSIETNEHFFLSCPKFKYERSVLMKKIKSSRIKTKVNMMKKILGFFEDVYCSKKKFELYKKEIKIILEASMDYISDTARFKQV